MAQLGPFGQHESDKNNPLTELGFPVNQTLPWAHVAPTVQLRSEQRVAERNANLMRGAFGRLGAGLDLMQSYRPGGAAALASGLYGQQAQILAASRTEAPDLMFWRRAHEAHRARKAGRRAQATTILGGAIQAVGTIAGGLIGGPAGAAVGGALGGAAGGAVAGGGGGGTSPQQPTGGPSQVPYSGLGGAQSLSLPESPAGQPGGPQPSQTFDTQGLRGAIQGAQFPSPQPTATPDQYGAPIGPRPAGGVSAPQAEAPGAPTASLMGMGSAGTTAMTQQLAADLGPATAANVVGMAKMDADPDDSNEMFYDMMSASLDQMAHQIFRQVFRQAG